MVKRSIIIENSRKFKEYVYSRDNKAYMGYIYKNCYGNYFFRKGFFVGNLGLGKCLKDIAERLIELNYKK